MTAIGIVAFGAVSALGEGSAAVSAGDVGSRARVGIGADAELAHAGLARPFAGRVAVMGEDRGDVVLARALTACAAELDVRRPGWQGERVGLVLGTSSGGMRAAEGAFAAIEAGRVLADTEAPTYYGPVARAARRLGVAFNPTIVVLGACASASMAIGLAMRCLARGSCDIILAGGFDEVTVFVAAGFEALRATTATPPPRPFRAARDGMSLGEGAAVLALVRADSFGVYRAPAHGYICGFGASSDAVHLTAPDPAGVGLGRAAAAALREAGHPTIDLVGAHATATPLNDVAEFRAIERALGRDRARRVVVHPFKSQIGHALGASGALELLACVDAIARGVLPACAGDGPVDGDAPVSLLAETEKASPKAALKLSSAFGGANAALVVRGAQAPDGPPRPHARAFVYAPVHVAIEPSPEAIAARVGLSVDRIARGDCLVRLALAAVSELMGAFGSLAGAGLVVGTALATIETNALFAETIRTRGVRAAEPRRFPYTSPNAVAGECSIAFGLTGPAFSVGGGMHAALEALACATWLVEAGDAERIVVVGVDAAGPVSSAIAGSALVSGAVALLVTRRPSEGGRAARARVGAIALRRGVPVLSPCLPGHRALVPLLAGPVRDLVCASPPDGWAHIVLDAV